MKNRNGVIKNQLWIRNFWYSKQCNAENIDCIKDSYWIYKDGANWETWIFTTKGLANEMLYWIRDCFFSNNYTDVEVCYKILNKLEKYYSKKE